MVFPCLLGLPTDALQHNAFASFKRDGQYSRTHDTLARLILVAQDAELV
jgi:hypothetical protein